MKNRHITISLIVVCAMIFATPFLLGNTGCDVETTTKPKATSGVKKATIKVKTQASGYTAEQENIVRKLKEDNKVGSIKYLYIVSAYSGDVLIYSTVKGKVTSSGKRLSPYVVAAAGSGEYKSEKGFPVTIGGKTHYTPEVLQDDGTYGSSIHYLYWWDTKGVGHIHYVSGGQIIHISDAPLVVGKVVINLDLNK